MSGLIPGFTSALRDYPPTIVAGRFRDSERAEGASDDLVEPAHDHKADRGRKDEEGGARVSPWHGIFFKGIEEDRIGDQRNPRAKIKKGAIENGSQGGLEGDTPLVQVLEVQADGAPSDREVARQEERKEVEEREEVDERISRVYCAQGVQAPSRLRGDKHQPAPIQLEDDHDEDGHQDDRPIHQREGVSDQPVLKGAQVKDLGDREGQIENGLQSVVPVRITVVVDDAIEEEKSDCSNTEGSDHVKRKVGPPAERPSGTTIGLMGPKHTEKRRGRKRKNCRGAGRPRFETPGDYIPFECAFVDCALSSIVLPNHPSHYKGYKNVCQRRHREDWHEGKLAPPLACQFCGEQFACGTGFYLDHVQFRCKRNPANADTLFRERYHDNYVFPPSNRVEKERHIRTMRLVRMHVPGLDSPVYPFDRASLGNLPYPQTCSIEVNDHERIKRQRR